MNQADDSCLSNEGNTLQCGARGEYHEVMLSNERFKMYRANSINESMHIVNEECLHVNSLHLGEMNVVPGFESPAVPVTTHDTKVSKTITVA